MPTVSYNPTQDTCARSDSTSAKGTLTYMKIGRLGSTINNGFIQFNPSAVKVGDQITSASLQIYAYTTSGTMSLNAYRVTSAWAENITYSQQPTHTTTGGSPAASVSGSNVQWVNFNVTNIVKSWFESGTANYGFAIITGTTTGTIPYFYSREFSTTSLRPILTITYESSNVYVNIGGTWKQASGVYVNIGGSWKTASVVKGNIGGTWR